MNKRLTSAQFARKRQNELIQEEAEIKARNYINKKREREAAFNESDELIQYNKFYKRDTKVSEDFIKFRDQLKDMLITESIFSIYDKAIPILIKEMCTDKGITLEDVEKGFIQDIIQENGGFDHIYNKMKRYSFLEDQVEAIQKCYKEVLECTDKENPETFGMPTSIKNGFYSDLAQATPDEVIETIKSRVNDSIDSFIDDNKKMKNAITDIYNNAQTKIQTTNDDAMKEHYQQQAKRNMKLAEQAKPYSVYGKLLTMMTEEIMMDEELFPQFINESTQRIDHEKCMGIAGVMYTLLETMNTLKLVNVDKSYTEHMFEEMADKIRKKKAKRDHSKRKNQKFNDR